MSPVARCKAKTKAWKRCRNRSVPGPDWCCRHAPAQEDETKMGPNERALVKTLDAMGQEEDTDAARWQMLRSLAKAVDLAPTRAALWAEYREALSELKKDAADADSSLDVAIEALRSASALGHTKN